MVNDSNQNSEDKIIDKKENRINTTDILVSEKLFSLKFTEEKRKLLLNNVDIQLESYEKNRVISLPNNSPSAISFSPRVPGVIYQTLKDNECEIFKVQDFSDLKRPENLEDVAFYSIPQLAYYIKNAIISSVELTQMYISRLKRLNEKLECVITFTDDLALEQAKKADKEIKEGNYKGILHGIPYGVKDLLSYPGYKTTWGATSYKDQKLDETATVIKKLEAAGAVMLAKLTLGALAWGDVWFAGKTKSPWNLEEGSSGSSAGSASATAAGLMAFAIGSETWGSIVSPSTACGTTGFRPSFGRVSRYAAMTLAWSMDKLGPITRSVEDAAIVFKFIHGKDTGDTSSISIPFNWDSTIKPRQKKIGYVKDLFESEDEYKFQDYDKKVLNQMKELNIELISIELPKIDPTGLSFILTAEAATVFDELTVSNEDDTLIRQTEDAWPNFFRAARFIPAVEYLKANRIRLLLMKEMHDMFQKYDIDVFIAPSFSDVLLLTNLTGHPAVVVPTGIMDNDEEGKGLPTSITFIGDLYKDSEALEFAHLYQNSTNHHENYPSI